MKIFCDGGRKQENGYWSVAVETADGVCTVVVDKRGSTGIKTHNEAEYAAVMESLVYIQNEMKPMGPIVIYSDSKLIVEQVNGNWDTKDERMYKLKKIILRKLDELAKKSYDVKLMWCPREENVKRLGH